MHLTETIKRLESVGIQEAQTEARILFEQIGKIPFHRLYAEDAFCDSPVLHEAIDRRLRREPLAYILGEVSFYRERYIVTPDVLIPRQDTEVLVENAIRLLPKNAHFLDFCTGSGCIAISVLNTRTDCTATAYDVSAGALEIANKNAALNGVQERLTTVCVDLLLEEVDTRNAVAIISNPPYIAQSEQATLAPELSFEPATALFAEEEGLLFYRHFLETYSKKLAPDSFFLFEIGYKQSEALKKIAAANRLSSAFYQDLGGHFRVAHCFP